MRKHNWKKGEITEYGFNWGGVNVERICHDNQGAVIRILGYRQAADIWITSSGKVRVIAYYKIKKGKLVFDRNRLYERVRKKKSLKKEI